MKKIMFSLTLLSTLTLSGCVDDLDFGPFDTVFNTCVLAGTCNGGF